MHGSTDQADDALTPRWPDGQLNRYRTVGGGRIDVVPRDGVVVELDCTGCGHHEAFRTYLRARRNAVIAHGRANEHAAICHAIPPPQPEE